MVALPPERRRALFALLVIACVGVAVAYAARAVQRTRASRDAATRADTAAARALEHTSTVMFRNEVPGTGWAQVALVPVAAPGGSRAIVPLSCRRLYFAGGRGLCVGEDRGFGLGSEVSVFGPDFKIQHTFSLIGLPSRARVSPDGRYGATTVFVAGHSYSSGEFSTETTIFDLVNGKRLGTLEDFSVFRDSQPFKSVDFNFWGVTFAADGNRFYATLKTKGQTYLVEGDLAARQMRVLRMNVECPSLSPDGTRLAFKKRTGGTLGTVIWRFHVLDLRTMVETPLAEARSIDDQIEWLDDRNVLYGLQPDIWTVPADGSGEPRRYLSRGVSPVVIRAGEGETNAPRPSTTRRITLPAADLGVTMSVAATAVAVGDDIPYTLVVTNHGPAGANQVAMDILLSDRVVVTSYAPANPGPYGCFVQRGYLSCTVDRLEPQQSWTLQLVLKAKRAGVLRHRVRVSTAQPDPVARNNSATATVQVSAAPRPR